MKIVKVILGLLALLIGGVLVIGLIADKNFDVLEHKRIKASKDYAMHFLKDYEQFVVWSPWAGIDPDVSYQIENNGEVGAKYSWKGNENVGSGEQIITKVTDNRIDLTLTFFEPQEDHGDVWFEVNEVGNDSIDVSWGFHSELDFIPSIFVYLMGAQEALRTDYVKGLENMKSLMEEKFQSYTSSQSNVSEIDFPATTFVAKKGEVKFEEISAFFGQHLPGIFTQSQVKGLEMTTSPCGLFFGVPNDETVKIGAAIGVKETEEIEGYELIKVPACKALQLDYYGPYETLESGLMELHDYVDKKGLKVNDMHIEEYITDPTQEPDSSKWLTKITFLIQ